ncbi:tRNA1(Val) (adenine(37)-N6)-methyltransferase [Catenovulum adriaticum]|uniref:Methyltransferase n=1 Tax=Catenovulum adriaticum TaxID=2984846 RepID=A0ABY7AI01_9ALTE|nr:methyltransferase [Catenovulum sp. TS8]WAJ69084.1 methyltransferase [Catenovulum sp. TS8]
MSEFRCKQFCIKQDKAAMKVGTDSLILGAWSQIDKLIDLVDSDKNQPLKDYTLLDIGSGTGLLSLMLAQKTQHAKHRNVIIDAIELDPNGFLQTQSNSMQSPWADRINSLELDFFNLPARQEYDWAIANPPYFQSDNCQNQQRQLARQLQGISWNSWFKQCANVIKEEGILELVIPTDITETLITAAQFNGFILQARLDIKSTPVKPAKRTCLRLKKRLYPTPNIQVQQQTLVIYDSQNQYTPTYKKLLKDFYLKF